MLSWPSGVHNREVPLCNVVLWRIHLKIRVLFALCKKPRDYIIMCLSYFCVYNYVSKLKVQLFFYYL